MQRKKCGVFTCDFKGLLYGHPWLYTSELSLVMKSCSGHQLVFPFWTQIYTDLTCLCITCEQWHRVTLYFLAEMHSSHLYLMHWSQKHQLTTHCSRSRSSCLRLSLCSYMDPVIVFLHFVYCHESNRLRSKKVTVCWRNITESIRLWDAVILWWNLLMKSHKTKLIFHWVGKEEKPTTHDSKDATSSVKHDDKGILSWLTCFHWWCNCQQQVKDEMHRRLKVSELIRCHFTLQQMEFGYKRDPYSGVA